MEGVERLLKLLAGEPFSVMERVVIFTPVVPSSSVPSARGRAGGVSGSRLLSIPVAFFSSFQLFDLIPSLDCFLVDCGRSLILLDEVCDTRIGRFPIDGLSELFLMFRPVL